MALTMAGSRWSKNVAVVEEQGGAGVRPFSRCSCARKCFSWLDLGGFADG
jgi:hypothetical protein